MPRMDSFTTAYFEAALWSTADESNEQGGEPLDRNYGIDDFAPETRDKMIADAADFQERFGELIADDDPAGRYGPWEQAGHDFWLTRNRHGAGFWDGDWPKHGDELAAASKEYGEFDLYVGDDGLIYGPPQGAYGVRERGPRRGHRRVGASRIAPGYPAERFRVGQDVAMISNPTNMGHVVGFDPDGSVMVQWSGGRAVSGVDARNLRAIGRGYAGQRASEARPPHTREARRGREEYVEEEYVETVDGEWMILVNGFQWGLPGAKIDRSGAADTTFATKAEAQRAYREHRLKEPRRRR